MKTIQQCVMPVELPLRKNQKKERQRKNKPITLFKQFFTLFFLKL
jgi:hypothetical protein